MKIRIYEHTAKKRIQGRCFNQEFKGKKDMQAQLCVVISRLPFSSATAARDNFVIMRFGCIITFNDSLIKYLTGY